ncbi:MAG: hypothetical protein COU27_01715 [Candidatus Levybacteria bacterium CG10_big_fil_rev_8_21_14_0_10_36_7]|nr:MAG: hypothetical protein COU27_01715 [Candidatus Levybacteria bacterium CG10_big_fil_rev_8_21_14_0_10_36_7]
MARPRDISEITISNKTGKSSFEWNLIIDKFNKPPKGHTEIAKHLREAYKVNPWWAQALTNRYEWERKLRNS